MRKGVVAVVLALAFAARAEDAKAPVAENFDKDTVGNAPEGFSFARTGKGPEGTWVIQKADDAPSAPNVLVQTSTDDTDVRFPVAVRNEGTWKDLAVSVKFKAISGQTDEAGGVVFRYQDANNYYLVRANALEDNIRIYSVKDGERRQFESKSLKVPPAKWHTIKVEAKGSHFTVWFDGQEAFQADDKTFDATGKVGVWTKADSVTQFDDLTVEEAK